MSSAAGVIVLSLDGERVVIVLQDKTNYGFPKGGRKKGESLENAAFRELEEETGLKKSQVLPVSKIRVEERNVKGNICVTYLVATMGNAEERKEDKEKKEEDSDGKDEKKEEKESSKARCIFTFDPKEIDEVKWMTIPEALDVLIPRRQKVLLEARSIVNPTASPLECGSESRPKPVDKEKQRAVWLSKTMSWALRHKLYDEKYNLQPVVEGYVSVERLMSMPEMQARPAEKSVTVEEIKMAVDTDEKQRFKLWQDEDLDGKIFIRANQGHSKPPPREGEEEKEKEKEKKTAAVILDDEKMMTRITTPLPVCVHGTNKDAWKKIKNTGLRPMGRLHIHFACEGPGKKPISGMRENSQVKIFVDMERAMKDGIEFFLSDNGVILSRGKDGVIAPEYFAKVDESTK